MNPLLISAPCRQSHQKPKLHLSICKNMQLCQGSDTVSALCIICCEKLAGY